MTSSSIKQTILTHKPPPVVPNGKPQEGAGELECLIHSAHRSGAANAPGGELTMPFLGASYGSTEAATSNQLSPEVIQSVLDYLTRNPGDIPASFLLHLGEQYLTDAANEASIRGPNEIDSWIKQKPHEFIFIENYIKRYGDSTGRCWVASKDVNQAVYEQLLHQEREKSRPFFKRVVDAALNRGPDRETSVTEMIQTLYGHKLALEGDVKRLTAQGEALKLKHEQEIATLGRDTAGMQSKLAQLEAEYEKRRVELELEYTKRKAQLEADQVSRKAQLQTEILALTTERDTARITAGQHIDFRAELEREERALNAYIVSRATAYGWGVDYDPRVAAGLVQFLKTVIVKLNRIQEQYGECIRIQVGQQAQESIVTKIGRCIRPEAAFEPTDPYEELVHRLVTTLDSHDLPDVADALAQVAPVDLERDELAWQFLGDFFLAARRFLRVFRDMKLDPPPSSLRKNFYLRKRFRKDEDYNVGDRPPRRHSTFFE